MSGFISLFFYEHFESCLVIIADTGYHQPFGDEFLLFHPLLTFRPEYPVVQRFIHSIRSWP